MCSFQVRIGHMDGIFVAYHNTAEIFGFQYLPLEHIDEILFGNQTTGESAFKIVIKLYENLLDFLLGHFDLEVNQSVRITFKLNKDATKLSLFAEKTSDVQDRGAFPTDLKQFDLTVSSLINGHRPALFLLDPKGDDIWQVTQNISLVSTNAADYFSARNQIAPNDSFSSINSDSLRIKDLKRRSAFNQSIMRQVQKSR